MESIISELVGKRIEVNCGSGVAFAGENAGIKNGILELVCEGKHLFVDLAKIIVVNEATDSGGKPGFIG